MTGKQAVEAFISDFRNEAVLTLENGRDGVTYNATNALTRSLVADVSVGFTGTTEASLSGLSHWRFVGNGRGPGKRPPLDPLIRWAKAKGIADTDSEARSLAYVVARSISLYGTVDHQAGGVNVFLQLVEDFQPRITDVLQAFLSDLKEPIASQFQKAYAA